MSDSLFGDDTPAQVERGDDRDAALIAAYESAGRTLDDLPYTPEFEALVQRVRARGDVRTPRELLSRLQNIRKQARLPKVGKAATTPPKVSDDEERLLVSLVAEHAGSVGKRDQLPYTEAFERLHHRFNERTGRAVDAHTLWRLIAKLAK